MVSPREMIIILCTYHELNHPTNQSIKADSPVELLIGIVVGRARPDLQLDPIGGTAVRDVQAFAVSGFREDLDATAIKVPRLRRESLAVLEGNDGAVGVGCRSKTFGCSIVSSLRNQQRAYASNALLAFPGETASGPM